MRIKKTRESSRIAVIRKVKVQVQKHQTKENKDNGEEGPRHCIKYNK